MKSTLALLVLFLSCLAWADAPGPVAAGKKTQLPKTEDKIKDLPKVDLGPQQCMAKCQKPAVRCMERCGTEESCAEGCGKDLEQCARSCGLKE
ncbi:hypothetical protein [Hyalangium sp.]|uniref:hypothetical protein n=1 Tax=Hyalangium sp. TaxID=2028555 RepID=UPI002D27E4FC|nr:hypothetical protein [Hyalangium sp.]HYH99810.1 hypothetical protein [Hyalangium sp.]